VIGGIASSAYAYGPGYGYYGGPGYANRGTATMAAMPLLITAGTPQRTATLPPTMADMDRVTALFAPHTHTTALGTIAGIVTVGDR
jgi:hypothetical protein